VGAVALTSPTSIQPESRVTTIGATSDGLVVGRELRFIPRVVTVFAFVMAFSFRS
jgi:hypothetical protein